MKIISINNYHDDNNNIVRCLNSVIKIISELKKVSQCISSVSCGGLTTGKKNLASWSYSTVPVHYQFKIHKDWAFIILRLNHGCVSIVSWGFASCFNNSVQKSLITQSCEYNLTYQISQFIKGNMKEATLEYWAAPHDFLKGPHA